jgi:hypothetical protein
MGEGRIWVQRNKGDVLDRPEYGDPSNMGSERDDSQCLGSRHRRAGLFKTVEESEYLQFLCNSSCYGYCDSRIVLHEQGNVPKEHQNPQGGGCSGAIETIGYYYLDN